MSMDCDEHTGAHQPASTGPASLGKNDRAVPAGDSGGQASHAGGTEAPMKHPSLRELLEYWNERRRRRLAPERGDIEPGAIRRVLADTFILSFEPSRGHPFRIAGTRVCALFRRQLKGEGFLNLWSVTSRNDICALLALVAKQSVGVIASAAAVGETDIGLSLELLLLPLRNHGEPDARLLGALAPSEPPLWLGTHTLSDLTVRTHRYVGPAAAGKIRPHAPLLPRGRPQHSFVIYDGGQA